jgi:hypothetical protein
LNRRVWAGLGVALGLSLALPAPALAHGLVGRADLPIPAWLFGWAAAIVLVVSFLALSVLWRTPRLQDAPCRPLAPLPVAVEVVCGVIGVAFFALVVVSGLAGTDSPTDNLAPTAIYVLFWVGLAVVSVALGDVFALFNPWRAVGRAGGWLVHRSLGGRARRARAYPVRLGRWPAAVGIAAFAWLELAYVDKDVPATLAWLALAYAAVQLAGMAAFGVAQWSRNGDAFGVYFGLYGRLGPLGRRRRQLCVRPPLAGAPSWPVTRGSVALLAVAIGATSFDGFSNGAIWRSLSGDLAGFFRDRGASVTAAAEWASTIGLIGAIAFVAAVYWTGIAGIRAIGHPAAPGELAGQFAHTLIPIAFAYAVAHYFSLLVFQGQAAAYLISDPLGDGSDVFGTADTQIDYGVVSASAIWYVQVGALIAGHVAALVLAHDRALALFSDVRDAARSQYCMLVVMVGFTSVGLWLLSSVNLG